MSNRPLILVTNDDGVMAPGIRAVAEALRPIGEVMVCAPDRERSAASHALTLDRPLRVEEIEPGVFAVDGTPADCAYLALLHIVPRKPALCISGINHGYNLGSDIFYSGTVAAAVEAALRGVPAIAISLERHVPPDFGHAARFARALAEETIARGAEAIPAAALLNVNLPHLPVDGYQVTFLGRRVYRDQVEVRHDLRGRTYYWIGGPEESATDVPGSDCSAVQAGRASVTPLGLDLTHHGLLHQLDAWQVGSFVRAAAERAR